MSSSLQSWENEYRNPKVMTKEAEPQSDLKRFLKFLRKERKVVPENLQVLDIGSGTGRNSNYLAELGGSVTGLELSPTALTLSKDRAKELRVKVDYRLHDIGKAYPFADSSFDLLLDIMSSNSLDEKGRAVYINECSRVLKPGGHFFVKALCKDGDDNAKALLRTAPGGEVDTYKNPDIGNIERVWSREDIEKYYKKYFEILFLEKKTNYQKSAGRTYKRNYWIMYLTKK